MLTCEEMDTLIHGYMDGELDALTNRQVEQHLDGCATCRAGIEGFSRIRASLRNQDLYYPAPTTLTQRIETAVRMDTQSLRIRRFPAWRNFAAAASVLVAFVAGWSLARYRTPDDVVPSEVVASHVRSLLDNHLTDVVSTDKHTVKPWFDGKIDFAPPVQRLDGTAFTLAGGRVDYMDDRPVAALVYRYRLHVIDLFVWPSTHPSTSVSISHRQGYCLAHWNAKNMTYWAIADVEDGVMGQFAREVRSDHN